MIYLHQNPISTMNIEQKQLVKLGIISSSKDQFRVDRHKYPISQHNNENNRIHALIGIQSPLLISWDVGVPSLSIDEFQVIYELWDEE